MPNTDEKDGGKKWPTMSEENRRWLKDFREARIKARQRMRICPNCNRTWSALCYLCTEAYPNGLKGKSK